MESVKIFDLLVFLLIVVVGVEAEGMIAKRLFHNHKFSFGRYVLLLTAPFIATLFAWYRLGGAVVYMFIVTALLGLFLEYMAGSTYSVIVGKRLWRYYRYNLDENTSWLAMPIWGLAGVLFLLVAHLFV